MSQSGLAVVSLKIFGGEYELAIRAAFLHSLAVIPGIDNQRALGLHGFVFVGPVEHDASADTTSCRFT